MAMSMFAGSQAILDNFALTDDDKTIAARMFLLEEELTEALSMDALTAPGTYLELVDPKRDKGSKNGTFFFCQGAVDDPDRVHVPLRVKMPGRANQVRATVTGTLARGPYTDETMVNPVESPIKFPSEYDYWESPLTTKVFERKLRFVASAINDNIGSNKMTEKTISWLYDNLAMAVGVYVMEVRQKKRSDVLGIDSCLKAANCSLNVDLWAEMIPLMRGELSAEQEAWVDAEGRGGSTSDKIAFWLAANKLKHETFQEQLEKLACALPGNVYPATKNPEHLYSVPISNLGGFVRREPDKKKKALSQTQRGNMIAVIQEECGRAVDDAMELLGGMTLDMMEDWSLQQLYDHRSFISEAGHSALVIFLTQQEGAAMNSPNLLMRNGSFITGGELEDTYSNELNLLGVLVATFSFYVTHNKKDMPHIKGSGQFHVAGKRKFVPKVRYPEGFVDVGSAAYMQQTMTAEEMQTKMRERYGLAEPSSKRMCIDEK